MRRLLIAGTLVEVALVVAVLAFYLFRIAASLRKTAATLAKVSFGVHAIETQCAPIGPGVVRINGQLATVAGALDQLAALANEATHAER